MSKDNNAKKVYLPCGNSTDEQIMNMTEDMKSNPLFLYLATELALQDRRLKELENEGRLNRATILDQQLRLDYAAQRLDTLTQRYDRLHEQSVLTQQVLDGVVAAVDKSNTYKTAEENEDFFNNVLEMEEQFGVPLTDLFDDPHGVLSDVDDMMNLEMSEASSLDAFMEE